MNQNKLGKETVKNNAEHILEQLEYLKRNGYLVIGLEERIREAHEMLERAEEILNASR